MKYSAKRSVIVRFYLYLCHIVCDFCLLGLAALRQVDNQTREYSGTHGSAVLFCIECFVAQAFHR